MRRRGFAYFDALLGLFLLAATGAAIIAGESGFERLDRGLADQRAATRTAERALASLQAGRQPPAEWDVTVVPLGTAAPAGTHWVRVEAAEHKRRAALVGLIGAAP